MRSSGGGASLSPPGPVLGQVGIVRQTPCLAPTGAGRSWSRRT